MKNLHSNLVILIIVLCLKKVMNKYNSDYHLYLIILVNYTYRIIFGGSKFILYKKMIMGEITYSKWSPNSIV